MFVNDEAALYYMCSLREQLCTAGKSDFKKDIKIWAHLVERGAGAPVLMKC